MELDTIVCGDCLDMIPTLQDSSVNLIISDWPYFKVKNLDWDRQWKTAEEYLDWIGLVCEQYQRILAPNGSLYAFASPEMADLVSIKIKNFFNMLNHIVWPKSNETTHALKYGDRFRQYVRKSERIIFAEHCGADNAAKGELGYGAKLRGFVFEPLRAYLAGERDMSGLSNSEINDAWCKWKGVSCTSQTQKWFSNSCFNPPTAEAYQWLRKLFNRSGDEYLCREYEDLRAEYEDLRAEYEDLRRPFNVTAQDQYTDVWEFPTVKAYPGKHPCEKPLEMLEHIIGVSSRKGDVVADFFCGSGVTAVAASNLGRRYFCCDVDQKWVNFGKNKVEITQMELGL